MDKLTYGRAERSDIGVIFEMESLLVKQYEDPTIVDLKHALQWCRTKIEGNWEAYTCIYCNGQKAGYFHLIPQPDLRTELDDLLILPSFRHQGIGRTVLDHILDETDESIYLYVYQKNQRAVSLYTEKGFQIERIVSPTRMILKYRK
jgi:ribosomal protein S18 acetylase RimI-like enzyme